MASETQSQGDEGQTGTGTTWVNLNNARSSNNVYSTATFSGSGTANTRGFVSFDFGFSAVTGTVDGMKVRIEQKRSGSIYTLKWRDVFIYKGGSIGSTNRSDFSALATSDTYKEFGGPLDKWDETWVAADITANDFGAVFSVDYEGFDPSSSGVASIDHVEIVVYYTPPGSAASPDMIGLATTGASVPEMGMMMAPMQFCESRKLYLPDQRIAA
jgi:hypothetical protein